MDATALPDGLLSLIKSTTRAAVAASVVPGSTGPQRVEQLTGYSPGQISRFQGDAYPDLVPLVAVFLLEFTSQKPVFARALASLTGHRLVPLEDGEAADSFITDLVALSATGGRLSAAYGEALADGKVTLREREELRRQIAQHAASLAAAERRLAGLSDPSPCKPPPPPPPAEERTPAGW